VGGVKDLVVLTPPVAKWKTFVFMFIGKSKTVKVLAYNINRRR